MARTPQGFIEKGSQRLLQLAVNEYPELLRARITQQLQSTISAVEWFSPLECDEYAEYSDQDFIDRLGVKLRKNPLDDFWPKRGGPQWDGLATTVKGQILLVEAKARINETKGSPSCAKSPKSIAKIDSSLKKTQKFLGANPSVNWANSTYYQYANRLAHLYFLAVLNEIDAYLLMIYFYHSANGNSPDSQDKWKVAIREQYSKMGLPQIHRLSDRIVNLHIDARDLGK